MSDYFYYVCPDCHVVFCDPPVSQDEEHNDATIFYCKVCNKWVTPYHTDIH